MSNNTYKVQKGDTLSGIASKYGMTWQDLYNNNKSLIDNTAKSHGVNNNFQNYIYANQMLNVGKANNTSSVANTPAATNTVKPTTSTPTTPTKTTQQLAQEYATAQTANVGNETNNLLQQYEKIAEQQKLGLQNQKLQTENQINSQREGIMQNYQNNARQAYINKMLAGQGVEQELSRAGLNTSGLVGSAYANVENAYGNNLVNLQNNRDNSIRDIDTQLNNAQLQYAIQENQLLSDIESAKLELQKYGNELAYNRYQDALANYMNFANFDYSKETGDRNYNYQLERDKVADEQWQKEYELALRQYEDSLKKNNLSSSRSTSRSSGYIGSSNNTSNSWIIDNESSVENSTSNMTTRASDWLNSMRSLEKSRGKAASREEIKMGITSAIKQNALTNAEAQAILKELGY